MPDRLLAGAKVEVKKGEDESDKDKEIKSLKQKLMAFERKEPDKTSKAALEEKLGKCPLCKVLHYYIPKQGPKKGQKLISDKLFGCDKFVTLPLEERAEFVVKNNACASCLSWNHERSSCSGRPNPCQEKGCKGKHNTILHG